MLFPMIARRFAVTFAVRASIAILVLGTALAAACDKMPLVAPSQSTINLLAAAASVSPSGSVDIIATVTEQAGTPVQNGTVVSFATTLGHIDPAEARTQNGKVTVKFTADGRSGTATVTAFSGGAERASIDLPVGGAAATLVIVRADPGAIPAGGGSVQIVAQVRDEPGNALSGVPVTFSTTAGALSPGTATTDGNGEARTTLTSTLEAVVTAQAGSQSPWASANVRRVASSIREKKYVMPASSRMRLKNSKSLSPYWMRISSFGRRPSPERSCWPSSQPATS